MALECARKRGTERTRAQAPLPKSDAQCLLLDARKPRQFSSTPASSIRTSRLSAYYDGPMPSHLRVCATFAAVVAFSFSARPGTAQPAPTSSAIDTLRPRFQSVLRQHGVVGGGLALVHRSASTETLAFGEMSAESHHPIDAATAYNWASI